MKVFSLPEYGLIRGCKKGDESKETENGVSLEDKDFIALESWVEQQIRLEEKSSPALNPGSIRYDHKERNALRVRNYAGIILLPSGNSLEILPKIAKNLDRDGKARSRKILLKMLSQLHEPSHTTFRKAMLDWARVPLLEIFIFCFLDEIGALLQSGLNSAYSGMEENLPALRGKLLFGEHIRQNFIHQERFYVTHDDYLLERPENRLIKSALQKVLKLSRKISTQKRCKDYLAAFENISTSIDIKADLLAARDLDRNSVHYKIPLFWSRILLQGNSPIPHAGKANCSAVLFAMETLFERYVYIQLKKQLAGWTIKKQKGEIYLFEDYKGRPFQILRPDLILEKDSKRVIVDTKWKNVERKADISTADMYQLFAYSEKHMTKQDSRLSFLVYPQTDVFNEPLQAFHFYQNKAILRAIPFNLETNHCPLQNFLPQ